MLLSVRLRLLALTALVGSGSNAIADAMLVPASAAPWSPIPSQAIYETGDAWIVGETRYRLYGVQSCLRGATFTNALGVRRDCGEASLAVLASLVHDLQPLCHQAAYRAETKTAFLFCFANLTEGPARGARVDLGTALITLGWAYAAVGPDGRAIHSPYAVAEQLAKGAHAGLWAFPDAPNPNASILRAYRDAHFGASAASRSGGATP